MVVVAAGMVQLQELVVRAVVVLDQLEVMSLPQLVQMVLAVEVVALEALLLVD